jgi:hypothetical protein
MMANIYSTQYVNWLCEMVFFGTKEGYSALAKKLQNTPFRYSVERDDCRAYDGTGLRYEYKECNRYAKKIDETEECTVLEMLIALARRMDDICCTSLVRSDQPRWFWRLLDNLGLSKFDDKHYEKLGGDQAVEDILNTWMNRTYKQNGTGGLFPMKNNSHDMRKIDIAMQMHHYLAEINYHF